MIHSQMRFDFLDAIVILSGCRIILVGILKEVIHAENAKIMDFLIALDVALFIVFFCLSICDTGKVYMRDDENVRFIREEQSSVQNATEIEFKDIPLA